MQLGGWTLTDAHRIVVILLVLHLLCAGPLMPLPPGVSSVAPGVVLLVPDPRDHGSVPVAPVVLGPASFTATLWVPRAPPAA